jgi:hypothetical protein
MLALLERRDLLPELRNSWIERLAGDAYAAGVKSATIRSTIAAVFMT